MNIAKIENSRAYLIEFLGKSKSPCGRLIYLNYYYNLILEEDLFNLTEIYIKEFLDSYLYLISKIDIMSVDYIYYEEILNTIKKLKQCTFLSHRIEELENLIQLVEDKISRTKALLENNIHSVNSNIRFPILELTKDENFDNAEGLLESITIHIKPTKQKTKFVIIPSDKEIDLQLKEQLKASYEYAINYLRNKKKKLINNYEVKISFEKILGHYEGNSLGTVLTILFIEQLLHVNNTAEIVRTTNNLASTGGHTVDGKLIACGREIIQKKVETVFYSDIQTFIIPKEDEAAALEKLAELNKKYPKRELNIIPIKNINDLFNRRDLIEIRKQNPIVRTAKILRRSPILYIIILILLILTGYNVYKEIDNNPAIIQNEIGKTYIKNKEGKTIIEFNNAINAEYDAKRNDIVKLYDINNDGINEIISSRLYLNEKKDQSKLTCYNNKGQTLWQTTFEEDVTSEREFLKSDYRFIKVYDTTTINNKKLLVCKVSHGTSFSSAIFFVELATGKRTGGVLWHSGHIYYILMKDIDSDGNIECIFNGANNGIEKSVLGIIDIKDIYNITSKCPSTKSYELQNMPYAKLKEYLLIPNSDYNRYYKYRMCGVAEMDFAQFETRDYIGTKVIEDPGEEDRQENYRTFFFSFDLKDIKMLVSSSLRARRDTLVKHKILSPPDTDTPEYAQLNIAQIEYWTGEKFISRKEWLEKQRK